jgi:hypothetical protein
MLGDLQNLYLLMEDLQSSINQAKNILKNNQVENPENVLRDLENIYNGVEFEDDEHKGSRTDKDIVTLAFIFLSGLDNDRIQSIYNQYCNTKSLYSTKFLSKWVDGVQNTIKNNKWFKPSEEKLQFIQEEVNKLISEVHSKYVPPQNKITKSNYIPNKGDDVVFENNSLIIYLADSMDKCIYYGDPKLCISSSKKDNYYWAYRLGKYRGDGLGMSTYFVNWKDGSNKILVDSLGDEDGPANKYSWNDIKSNNDRDISKEDLIEKFPDLAEPFQKDVFQFVPYGKTEQRAYEIDENVTSILDPELQGFDDYDIFIQIGRDITSNEWDELEMDINTKKILFKKYLGTGKVVEEGHIKKYGDPKDLSWYEDVISRSLENSLLYYISRDGKVGNPKILEHYNEEVKKSEGFKDSLISIKDGKNTIIAKIPLYILPDLSDLKDVDSILIESTNLISLKGLPQKCEGIFYCRKNNNLISLEGSPQEIGGSFHCEGNKNLKSLKGAPQQVGGYFNCSYNKNLTSLEGCPQKVGGNFSCTDNNLISLKGAPQKVVYFNCRYNENLKSLEGGPQEVGGAFNCSSNKLTSLKGAPQKVGAEFMCHSNYYLKSLEGAPQKVGGDFYCGYTGLTSLEGAPQKIGGSFYCDDEFIYDGITYDETIRNWGLDFRAQIESSIKNNVVIESFNFSTLLDIVGYIHQCNTH